ncbi:MAG: very short patch repair endonuclease [Gemmataceae bacterium]|nr:very short patch repair endonuclease [Gemmataceae bacterium]
MDRITRDRRAANMAAIRGKDTGPERAVRRFLHAAGFRFRLHPPDLPGRPDIVLPRYRAAVLVHGCFWHTHDCPLGRVRPKTNAAFWVAKRSRTVARDAEKAAALRRLGWRVRTVWECEIEAGTFSDGLGDWVRGAT